MTTKTKRNRAVVLPRSCPAGFLFRDSQTMRTVRLHEKLPGAWWCEGVDEPIGLWAYSTQFIMSHALPNEKMSHCEPEAARGSHEKGSK